MQQNTFTPGSLVGVIILIVLLPLLGYLIGSNRSAQQTPPITSTSTVSDPSTNTLPAVTTTPPVTTPPALGYYENVKTWQTTRLEDAGLSIATPLDFPIETLQLTVTNTDWRLDAGKTIGTRAVLVSLPKAIQSQTNFREAKVVVGISKEKNAIQTCLQKQAGEEERSAQVINGVPFAAFTQADAGAGNMYQTTSYRAIRNSSCYVIEYTIHSTQLANYPKELGLKEFDQTYVKNLLERIISTIRWN